MAFTLTGPGGYTAFSNLSTSSPLIDLAASGSYTLAAFSPNGETGSYSFQIVQTTVTALPPATAYNGTWAGSGQAQLFSVPLTTADPLSIELTDPSTTDHTELYARFGAPPTRQTYDYAENRTGSSQSLLIPEATAGTWYVLVYGASIPSAPSSFTVSANSAEAVVTSFTPTYSGNGAATLVTLNGVGFMLGSSVAMIANGGTSYDAQLIHVTAPKPNDGHLRGGRRSGGSIRTAVVPAGRDHCQRARNIHRVEWRPIALSHQYYSTQQYRLPPTRHDLRPIHEHGHNRDGRAVLSWLTPRRTATKVRFYPLIVRLRTHSSRHPLCRRVSATACRSWPAGQRLASYNPAKPNPSPSITRVGNSLGISRIRQSAFL